MVIRKINTVDWSRQYKTSFNCYFTSPNYFYNSKTAQYLQDSLLAKPALALSQDLRTTLFRKLQKSNILFIEKLSSGDIAYRLTEDVDRVGEVIYKSIQDTAPSIFQLLAVFGYMIFIDWNLSLATIILAPLIALLVSDFGGRVLRASEKSQNKISALAGLLSEAQGLPMVKLCSRRVVANDLITSQII